MFNGIRFKQIEARIYDRNGGMDMEEYINRIIEVCSKAKPNQVMMFDDFGKYVLHVTKDENFIEGTDNYNMVDIAIYEKNAVKREGRFKDLLVGDEVGIHVLDMYCVLKGIADGTRIVNETLKQIDDGDFEICD